MRTKNQLPKTFYGIRFVCTFKPNDLHGISDSYSCEMHYKAKASWPWILGLP